MKVFFSKYAKQELDDATQYYEIEYQGLGKRFREEVRKAAKRIKDIRKHGPLNGVMSGSVFFISFRTSFSVQLKQIIYS